MTRHGLLVLIAVLLVGGLPFFSRLWFAPQAVSSHRSIPAASPSITGATVAPAVSPALKEAESSAQEARRKRLQAESRQLKQTNTALETARQKAESDKKRAEKNTDMMATLNAKLLDPNLKVPPTVSEAGLLMGQNLADAAKFKQKWGDTPPGGGYPRSRRVCQGARCADDPVRRAVKIHGRREKRRVV